MTTFTVPRTARPIAEGMFADLGVPHVDFTPTGDGGQHVTVPTTLTDAQVLRGKIRLLTSTQADEDALVAAVSALAALDQVQATAATYAASTPTAAQAVAATTALAGAIAQLAGDVRGLIEWVGRDALAL